MIELGTNVLTDEILKKILSPADFHEFCTIKEKKYPIGVSLANALAEAMKTWAMQAGATHYTHWFFPLTGKSAGKQISFFEKTDGQFIANFEGKNLIKGETDASSFPSGGERMTFEARGYTVWDYTSQTVLYENKNGEKILLLPTAFCSYHGTALDEKTPLLRAQKRLDDVSVEILHTLGKNDVSHVESLVGGEQEYFLIDRSDFLKRPDLVLTGRTLLGTRATKTQNQHHHYFGAVSTKVAQFFKQVNDKLWRMGVVAKLQHNEVAPCQHELVPMYAPSNLSCDQNQLIMQVLCEQAEALGMTVLLHEKPFMGMNGSGKHTNWSLATDTGLGLLDASGNDQLLFLLFFTAVLAAIAKHAGLLKLCATTYENELRLGGNEAPPAIVSVFIGEQLQNQLEQILSDQTPYPITNEPLQLGVPSLNSSFKDNCDRNRTSPFAYTGNKFEFRMVGSGQSLAFPCTVLNTIVAHELSQALHVLQHTNKPLGETVQEIIKQQIATAKPILFNGNGYSKSWHIEAKKRNLPTFDSVLNCYKQLTKPDVINLFETQQVLNPVELHLRYEILLERYLQNGQLDAQVMHKMLLSHLLPILQKVANDLFSLRATKYEQTVREQLVHGIDALFEKNVQLHLLLDKLEQQTNSEDGCAMVQSQLLPLMNSIQNLYSELEPFIPEHLMPMPDYDTMLYRSQL